MLVISVERLRHYMHYLKFSFIPILKDSPVLAALRWGGDPLFPSTG